MKPDDVVFAKIGADLDFDEFEHQLAGIREAVPHAQRNLGALVFPECEYFVSASHLGGATYDDPALRAMMMHLEREPLAGFDLDAFDLIALAFLDALVTSPGPEHFAVVDGFLATRGLQ